MPPSPALPPAVPPSAPAPLCPASMPPSTPAEPPAPPVPPEPLSPMACTHLLFSQTRSPLHSISVVQPPIAASGTSGLPAPLPPHPEAMAASTKNDPKYFSRDRTRKSPGCTSHPPSAHTLSNISYQELPWQTTPGPEDTGSGIGSADRSRIVRFRNRGGCRRPPSVRPDRPGEVDRVPGGPEAGHHAGVQGGQMLLVVQQLHPVLLAGVGGPFQRLDDLLAVSDPLHVHENDRGLLLVRQVFEQVGLVQVRLVAHRYDGGQPYVLHDRSTVTRP